MEPEVPQEFIRELLRIFELAARKGGYIYYGGKIVISTEKPKPGQKQKIRGTVVKEITTEI